MLEHKSIALQWYFLHNINYDIVNLNSVDYTKSFIINSGIQFHSSDVDMSCWTY